MKALKVGDRVRVNGISRQGTWIRDRKGTVSFIRPIAGWIGIELDKSSGQCLIAEFKECDCKRLVKRKRERPSIEALIKLIECQKRIDKTHEKLFGTKFYPDPPRTMWEISYPNSIIYTAQPEAYDTSGQDVTITEFVEVIRK